MRSFQESLKQLEARHVRVVAISIDPPEITREHARKQGYTFTFLADPNAEVIRRYDLFHEGSGYEGGDTARPAEFLIDPSGIVRWVNMSNSYTVRARPTQVFEALGALEGATSTQP